MYKQLILIVCLLFSVSVMAETVYKKTNPDGSVTFTDQQSTDSKEVEVREPTSFAPPRLPRLDLPTKKLKPKYNYAVSINKPSNDATILNQPDVTVSVSVSPDVSQYGHQIRYQLSDQSIISRNKSATFSDVPRGTHVITISIVDSSGELVSSGASSTFHMKRFFKKP